MHTRAGQGGQDGEAQEKLHTRHHFHFAISWFLRILFRTDLDGTTDGERLWAAGSEIMPESVQPIVHCVSLEFSLGIPNSTRHSTRSKAQAHS